MRTSAARSSGPSRPWRQPWNIILSCSWISGEFCRRRELAVVLLLAAHRHQQPGQRKPCFPSALASSRWIGSSVSGSRSHLRLRTRRTSLSRARAAVPASVTSQFEASIFTARYVRRVGLRSVIHSNPQRSTRSSNLEPTLAITGPSSMGQWARPEPERFWAKRTG